MDGIIDQVRRMPLAEKRRLAEALRQAIAEELASGSLLFSASGILRT